VFHFSFPSQVNERAARLVAATIATVSVVALGAQWGWLIPLLAVGFLLRVGWGPRFSLLARLAMWGAPKLWDIRRVAGPPKRFAQGIGAAVTLTASLLLALGQGAGWWLVAVLALFASLEALFSFCMGCWVYGQLQQRGVFPPDVCNNCNRQLS